MCKRFDEWSEDIKSFCESNGLDFDKTSKLVQSWGRDDLIFQYHDPEKGKMGLLDETPMPIVLVIQRMNGKLVFTQTEHTKKYLA